LHQHWKKVQRLILKCFAVHMSALSSASCHKKWHRTKCTRQKFHQRTSYIQIPFFGAFKICYLKFERSYKLQYFRLWEEKRQHKTLPPHHCFLDLKS
jgi:hypothetical protein